MPPSPSAAASSPVRTHSTPGMARASAVSMPSDPRMSMGRQDERAPRHARQHDVADIAPLAGEEAVVLDPPHALSDAAFRHARGHSMQTAEREAARNLVGPRAFPWAMTGKIAAGLILALGLTCAALAAHADCRQDLQILQARLAAGNQKAPNVVAANKELAKAQDAQSDEVTCDDRLARAWNAYRKPAPDPDQAQQ